MGTSEIRIVDTDCYSIEIKCKFVILKENPAEGIEYAMDKLKVNLCKAVIDQAEKP